MNLQEFLSIKPVKKFRPKDLWKAPGPFAPGFNDKPAQILSGAKWKASAGTAEKPFSMSVRVNRKGRIVFQYDPLFMSRLMEFPYWFKNTIYHELMHVFLGHVTYRRPEKYDRTKWNIACDLAINSILSNGGRNPEHVADFILLPGRDFYRNLPHYLSSEEYYEIIKSWKIPKDENHKFNNRTNQKRDRIFTETDKAEFSKIQNDLFHNIGTGILPGAYNDYVFVHKHEASIGQVPELEALLLKITELRKTEFSSTRRVRNRRYPEYPGKRVEREPEPVVLMVDWSESVKPELLDKMDHFVKMVNKSFPVVYVPFTTDIISEQVTTYKVGTFRNSTRGLMGGTCLDASLKSVYSKFPGQNQIIVLVSDFNDNRPVSVVRKNVFGVYAESYSHHINDHSEFHGKIFKI